MAGLAGLTEDEVMTRVQRLLDKRIIREITPIFDTRALGYQSMLVAAKVDAEHPHRAAKIINSHPGVTHNYLRNHDFNLWFTIAVEPGSRLGLQGTLDALAAETGAQSIRQLPTLKLFKIRMDLEMEAGTDALQTAGQAVEPIELEPIEVTEEDVATIVATQGPMPVVPEPYAPAAERLGVSQEDVLRRLESLRERGGLRRVAAILYHRRAGFSANGMGVWKVPDAEILETGKRMAAFRGVSHCYQRPTYADWPYSVFTMAHGRSKEECDAILDSIAADDRHQRAGHAVLLDRVQEGPDALLHRRLPALGGGAGLTTSISDVRSAELYRRALHVLPGGVNSPVRAMRSIGRDPIFIERAEGAEIIDVDGNTYVDYVCSWGPLILGHAHPAVLEAVADAAARGTTFGAPTVGEVELAELVGARMPAVDMLRMTSSGTEATMSALRLARAATGREKILKFAGAYHGHVDGLLAQAGSGLATQGIPASPGVPEAATARDRRGAVERRGGGAEGVRRARARRRHLRALPGQHGPRHAGLRLPRAAARAGDRARGAADLRRGHHRLPDRARRRPGADRRARRT